jgi:hypothetical protein
MNKTLMIDDVDWIADLDVDYDIVDIPTSTFLGTKWSTEIKIKNIEGDITFYDNDYKETDVRDYDECAELKDIILSRVIDNLECEI